MLRGNIFSSLVWEGNHSLPDVVYVFCLVLDVIAEGKEIKLTELLCVEAKFLGYPEWF